MRLLAVSDWSSQSIDSLVRLVRKHHPAAVLYAGDDIHRVIPTENQLFLRIPNQPASRKYPELTPVDAGDARRFSRPVVRLLEEVRAAPSSLEKPRVPIYYVDGNADCLIHEQGRWYVRVHEGRFHGDGRCYRIVSNGRGQFVVEEDEPLPYWNPMEGPFEKRTFVPSVEIYAPLKGDPCFGRQFVKHNGRAISLFGFQYGKGPIPQQVSDILLCHEPPYGKLDLSGGGYGIYPKGKHIGSKTILGAIKKLKPRYCICGHTDFWGGESVGIGRTTLINVAQSHSTPESMTYALIETRDWTFRVHKERVQSLRWRKIAGYSPLLTEMRRRDRQSSHDYRSAEDMIREAQKLRLDSSRFEARVQSMSSKRPQVVRPLSRFPPHTAFIDVETGLSNGRQAGRLWLIGLFCEGSLAQFEIPADRGRFLASITKSGIRALASWSRYDHEPVRDLLESGAIGIKFLDVCQRVRQSVVWWRYELHEFYKDFFGRDGSSPELIPGGVAGLLADHLILDIRPCRLCPSPSEVRQKIKERNRQDLLQMARLCRSLEQAVPKGSPRA